MNSNTREYLKGFVTEVMRLAAVLASQRPDLARFVSKLADAGVALQDQLDKDETVP